MISRHSHTYPCFLRTTLDVFARGRVDHDRRLRVPCMEPVPRNPGAVSALNEPHREVDVKQVTRCHAAAEHPAKVHFAISREASIACNAADRKSTRLNSS